MSANIIAKVKEIQQELNRTKTSIIDEHSKLIKYYNQMCLNALKKVSNNIEALKILLVEIEKIEVGDQNFSDFSDYASWKAPKLTTDPNIYLINPYIIEDFIGVLQEYLDRLETHCEHPNPEFYRTRCKRPHCKRCLKQLFESNQSICPCGEPTSKKDEHQILGFPKRL